MLKLKIEFKILVRLEEIPIILSKHYWTYFHQILEACGLVAKEERA
jgi:hypothetical protein